MCSMITQLTYPGNVFLFSSEDYVEELFLCFSCYCSISGKDNRSQIQPNVADGALACRQ